MSDGLTDGRTVYGSVLTLQIGHDHDAIVSINSRALHLRRPPNGCSELDNSTVSIYSNYSTSDFKSLSALGTLNTATVIIFAVAKPPIAKISNVIGRGQTLAMTVCFYLLAYILMSSAKTLGPYAGGLVFYNIGQSGMNVMTVFSFVLCPPRVLSYTTFF